MEIIRKKRNLENYTVRSIPKSVLKKDKYLQIDLKKWLIISGDADTILFMVYKG